MSYCSDITKNRILECAKGEFLSKGFENAQVAEIAKLAKVTTGAIYRHFKNKEALFFALIEEEYNYTLDVVSDVEKRSEQKTIRIDSDLVDDEAIIENLLLETMLFVDYMYAHFDNFKLIFACSKGSQVENFIEDVKKELRSIATYMTDNFCDDYTNSLNYILAKIKTNFEKNIDDYALIIKAKIGDKDAMKKLQEKIENVANDLKNLEDDLKNIILKEN